MKKVDNLFSILYVVSFVASILIILSEIYDIKAILGYVTDPIGILGILYLSALLLSAFYHHKISKREIITKVHKSLTIVTTFTFVSLFCLIIFVLNCDGEACNATILPAATTIGLWIISLILGTVTFRQRVYIANL